MLILRWPNAPTGAVSAECARRALWGSSKAPLSAQAQTPSRPSGANKEQQTAKNEGRNGPSLVGSPRDRAEMAANRHAALVPAKVAENGKDRVNLGHRLSGSGNRPSYARAPRPAAKRYRRREPPRVHCARPAHDPGLTPAARGRERRSRTRASSGRSRRAGARCGHRQARRARGQGGAGCARAGRRPPRAPASPS